MLGKLHCFQQIHMEMDAEVSLGYLNPISFTSPMS